MLQIRDLFREYVTGDLKQIALDGISLNFRDNEFVAILGPSGSGKTTLLNIIGGLDQYDFGDLIIDGISTKNYDDRDWDSYRNHSIGFVFQSYNLIPHQTVLENVALALTISGVSKSERRERAKEALKEVGLEEHINKRPNQLSGGQMQRVAIARALVNDPDILLADEPTGALDSETSIQIMDLLKEVAKDRLVIMVTHNPELAVSYATRIVELKDGRITSDTDPYEVPEQPENVIEPKKYEKTSMSFLTALSLSFKNLRTKITRTLLTAFAGSIGIIGIALILSLSNGVNQYITDIQRDTMVSYPVSIEAQGIDLSGMVNEEEETELGHELDKVYSNPRSLEAVSSVSTSVSENNLTAFKKYLDDPESEIHDYIGENGVVYSYDTRFDIFSRDPNDVLINTDGSDFEDEKDNSVSFSDSPLVTGKMPVESDVGIFGSSEDNNAEELIPGQNGDLISSAITENYDLLAGKWPKSKEEVVLVLDHNNEINAVSLYQLGILPSKEYKSIKKKIDAGEEVKLDKESFDYEDLIGKTFQLIPEADYYQKNSAGHYDYVAEDTERRDALLDKALKLKISAIIRAKDEDASNLISEPLGYTNQLTNYIIDKTDKSAVVKDQKANKEVNVLNGFTFSPKSDAEKVEDATNYLRGLGVTEKAAMMSEILNTTGMQLPPGGLDEATLSGYLDNYLANPDETAMLEIYDNYISPGSYEDNLTEFGVISRDAPSEINLYADTFDDKNQIGEAIEHYNDGAREEDKITYTDFVALLMSSVTTIINVITWVLVAFVAVALVVSSIMIGIITYISVLERTREIGILRSIGASKANIAHVFNAETIIIGFISGIIGIGLTLAALVPVNILVHALVNSGEVNAQLPLVSGVVLVLLSVVLTFIGGLIPSRKAAKKDPVTALRTE